MSFRGMPTTDVTIHDPRRQVLNKTPYGVKGSNGETTRYAESTPGGSSYFPKDPWDWYIHLHEWLIFMVNVGEYTIHGSFGYLVSG